MLPERIGFGTIAVINGREEIVVRVDEEEERVMTHTYTPEENSVSIVAELYEISMILNVVGTLPIDHVFGLLNKAYRDAGHPGQKMSPELEEEYYRYAMKTINKQHDIYSN